MYYVIHYDPTLLYQTNEDNNKVYEKNRPIFTIINVWRKYLPVKCIILPMFIFDKKKEKSGDPTDNIKQV